MVSKERRPEGSQGAYLVCASKESYGAIPNYDSFKPTCVGYPQELLSPCCSMAKLLDISDRDCGA